MISRLCFYPGCINVKYKASVYCQQHKDAMPMEITKQELCKVDGCKNSRHKSSFCCEEHVKSRICNYGNCDKVRYGSKAQCKEHFIVVNESRRCCYPGCTNKRNGQAGHCRVHHNEYSKTHYKGKKREYAQKRLGMIGAPSYDEQEEIIASYNGTCPYCKRINIKRWQAHHNHDTGEYIAIICSGCNVAFGHLNDDTTIMENALACFKRDHDKIA